MKKINNCRKKSSKSEIVGTYFFLAPEDIYTGYIYNEFHNNLYKLNKNNKNN